MAAVTKARTKAKSEDERSAQAAPEAEGSEGTGPQGEVLSMPVREVRGVILSLEAAGTPLVVHRFGEKAQNQIRESQAKKAKAAAKPMRGPAEIAEEVMLCHHPVAGNEKLSLAEGRFGFPCMALKQAAVRAAKEGLTIAMIDARTAFFVAGELFPVRCARVEPHSDWVRLKGMGSPVDLRYRPYYYDWQATVGVEYWPDKISLEQLVNIFEIAGATIGIGENRGEKTGNTYGRFRVVSAEACSIADLPAFRAVREDNKILAKAREIARRMGAVT
jgi:hypothetical protein